MNGANREFSIKEESPLKRSLILPLIINKKNIVIPFIGLIAVAIFFQIFTNGRLISFKNTALLINYVFTTTLGSIALLFVLTQGGLDFSMGAIAGASAAIAAQVIRFSTVLSLPVAIITGLIIGCINGFIHAKLNVSSFITTLSMSYLLNGITLQILNNGTLGIPIDMLKFDNLLLKLTILIVMTVLGFILFEFTAFGKNSKAIGANIEAARQSGVNIWKNKMAAFMVTGCMSGFIGYCALIRSGTASVNTGTSITIESLLALMLGGLSLAGGAGSKYRAVLIGSVTIALLTNGMVLWGIDVVLQQIIRGLLFLFAICISFDRSNVVTIK